MSNREDIEQRLELAADLALRTRDRIDSAIRTGEVPAWIQDACNVLERASVQYGELSEKLGPAVAEEPASSPGAPAPLFAFQSLTLH